MRPNVSKLGSCFGSSSREVGETKGKKKRTKVKRKDESSQVEIIIRRFGGKARRRFGLRNVPSQLFIVLSIYLLAEVARYRVKSKAFTGPCSRVPRQRQRKRKRGARTVEKIRARVWSSEKEIPMDVLFSIFLSLCFSRCNEIEAFQTLGREIAVS